jgi:hypothetical protein
MGPRAAMRDFRGDDGNVGIIRSPDPTIVLLDLRQHHVGPPPVPRSLEDSEGDLQPELNVAAASRTDDRIAGGDVGCGASAAERAAGRPGVTASTVIIH